MAQIVQLLASPIHRYAGRPGVPAPDTDEPAGCIEIRAHLGVVGDRYFNSRAHRDASVTVLAAESLAGWPGADLRATRRNILLCGVDVDATAGRVLQLDSGDGPVQLLLRHRANPCRWMDLTVGEGAWRALRGHGGMRCEPLTDGVLRVGPVEVSWLDYASP